MNNLSLGTAGLWGIYPWVVWDSCSGGKSEVQLEASQEMGQEVSWLTWEMEWWCCKLRLEQHCYLEMVTEVSSNTSGKGLFPGEREMERLAEGWDVHSPHNPQISTHIWNERTESGSPTGEREFKWEKRVCMPLNLLCNSSFWQWVFRKKHIFWFWKGIWSPSLNLPLIDLCYFIDIWGYFYSIFTLSPNAFKQIGWVLSSSFDRGEKQWLGEVWWLSGEFGADGPETRSDFWFRALLISPKYLGKPKLIWSEWQRRGAWSQEGFWGEGPKVSWKWLLLMSGQKGRKHQGETCRPASEFLKHLRDD